MAVGTMLLSKRANLLRFDPNRQPPWCSLNDPNDRGNDTVVDVQVFEQPNGRFQIIANHAVTRTSVLNFFLNEVHYEVKEPAWHEVTVHDQKYAIQFNGERDGQGFATIVQNSLHEIKRAGTDNSTRFGNVGIPLPGLISPRTTKEAWSPPGGISQSGMVKAGTLPASRSVVSGRPSQISTTRRPADFSKVPSHDELMLAIARGDVNAAKTIAAMLAENKTQLHISPSANARPSRFDQGQPTISIRVHIEDKFTSGGRIPLKVKPTMTIAELKREISDKYSFPEAVQQWIVGKRLAKDVDTLVALGVASGSSVYLYLMSADSVGLTKERYENEKLARLYPNQNQGNRQAQNGQGSDIGAVGGQTMPRQQQAGMVYNVLPGDERIETARPNQMAATHAGVIRDLDDYHEEVTRRPTQPPPPPPTTQQQQQQQHQPLQRQPSRGVGWECPVCTFINEPTRPGCEICSASKPEDFVPPENYQPSEREKERLNEEARNRELLQQAEEEERKKRTEAMARLIGAIRENADVFDINDDDEEEDVQILHERQNDSDEENFRL